MLLQGIAFAFPNFKVCEIIMNFDQVLNANWNQADFVYFSVFLTKKQNKIVAKTQEVR